MQPGTAVLGKQNEDGVVRQFDEGRALRPAVFGNLSGVNPDLHENQATEEIKLTPCSMVYKAT